MNDVVTINIIGFDDESILKAMDVLSQTFFDRTLRVQDEDATLVFRFHEEIEGDMITVIGVLNGHQQLVKRQYEENHVKTRKYAYLAVYALLLEHESQQKQSWGLLNGMRPTKLVHGLKKRGYDDDYIKDYLQAEYLVSDEKVNLLLTVANHQLGVIPDLHRLEQEVSIYIGIPFCPTRCAYCTFAAYAYGPFKKWVEPFLETLLKEIKGVGAYIKEKNLSVTSIYLGGGTATTLTTSELEKLLAAIYKEIANWEQVREMTVEAGRPDTITKEKLELLKQFKIGRISINPQSFNQDTLERIGRHHEVTDVVDKFMLAKACGIENVNMDLIVGLPGEGEEELRTSLEQIRLLAPESLTVHMLAYKRKSKMTQDRSLYTTASTEVLQTMGQMTYNFAKQQNYHPYYLYRQKNISGNMENIGYSKAGQESIYNIVMMEEAQNVLGLGVGASSKFLIGTSVHNPKDLKTYIETYEAYVHKKLKILDDSLFGDEGKAAQAFVKNDY